MFKAHFWKDAFERAVKTTAQAFAGVLIADGTGLFDTDWPAAVGFAGMAAVLSILTSLGSEAINPNGTASLVSLPPGHRP